MPLAQQLAEYVSACFSALWVQSFEHEDALREIAEMCREQKWRLATWDVEQGLQIPGQANGQPADSGGNDPLLDVMQHEEMRLPKGRIKPDLAPASVSACSGVVRKLPRQLLDTRETILPQKRLPYRGRREVRSLQTSARSYDRIPGRSPPASSEPILVHQAGANSRFRLV